MGKLTQKQKRMIENYKRATTTTLDECYNNASCYKWRAYHSILDECYNKNNGYGVKVFGANCSAFCMAYLFEQDGQTMLVYHTKDNRYLIPIE